MPEPGSCLYCKATYKRNNAKWSRWQYAFTVPCEEAPVSIYSYVLDNGHHVDLAKKYFKSLCNVSKLYKKSLKLYWVDKQKEQYDQILLEKFFNTCVQGSNFPVRERAAAFPRIVDLTNNVWRESTHHMLDHFGDSMRAWWDPDVLHKIAWTLLPRLASCQKSREVWEPYLAAQLLQNSNILEEPLKLAKNPNQLYMEWMSELSPTPKGEE